MKVVHVVWSLTLGGIETMLVNIANAQANEGADVSVVIINDMYDDSVVKSFCNKINLIFLHRKRQSYDLRFIIRLNRALHFLNPDAIHLHSSRIYTLIFSKKLRQTTFVTLHDLPKGTVEPKGFVYRLFPFMAIGKLSVVGYIDKVPKVFAISNAVKNDLWKKYGVFSTVVCNGIRTSDFTKRELIPCASPLRIIQVSRLDHNKKGQDLLIRAIAQLNGVAEVGFIGEGQSLEYLKKLVTELGVEKYVHFLGKRTQDYIAKNLCKYDLFVQPSRYEGFGLTVAEAMAAQVPVLVSSGQGPAEATCGKRYGWVFENDNVDDLARMIAYIREHYAEALKKAKEARQYVMETYDVSVTARKYLEEYKN